MYPFVALISLPADFCYGSLIPNGHCGDCSHYFVYSALLQ
jgi:hypothetical protein